MTSPLHRISPAPDGHGRVGHALAMVLGVAALSLLASAALAAVPAAVRAVEAASAAPVAAPSDDDGLVPVDLIDVPAASAEAISL